MSLFPWDDQELLAGRTRILRAPFASSTAPAGIHEVIDMESPYDPVSPWEDFGAAREGASYSRGISTEGYEIEQVDGVILEEVTDIERIVSFSVAELKAEHFQIIEEGKAPEAVAAAAGHSAQEKVAFGSITDLTPFRIAFIAQRPIDSGVVIETDASERGRLVMGVLHRATITSDEVEIPLEKGSLVHAPVAFKSLPVAGAATGEENGAFYTEDAGTIAA